MGSALLLAAVAASAGTDEAIKEASRRIANEQDRQTALFSAGQALLGQRLYKECADLMEAGSSGRPNSAALKTAIDTIRKTRRREDLPDAPNDPAALLTELFPAILLPNLPPGTFMNLLSASSPLRKPDAQKRMYNEAGPFRAQVEKSGVSAETAVDIALWTAHTVVDGDDAGGLRVRAEVVGGQKSNKMTIYVVKEEGQYRVRSIADSPSLGTEAFARIERGEIDNARRWLDWARDEERLAGGEDPLAGPVFPVLDQGRPRER